MILNKYIMTFFLATSIALIIHAIENKDLHYTKTDVAQNDKILKTKTSEYKDTHAVLQLIHKSLPNLIIQK